MVPGSLEGRRRGHGLEVVRASYLAQDVHGQPDGEVVELDAGECVRLGRELLVPAVRHLTGVPRDHLDGALELWNPALAKSRMVRHAALSGAENTPSPTRGFEVLYVGPLINLPTAFWWSTWRAIAMSVETIADMEKGKRGWPTCTAKRPSRRYCKDHNNRTPPLTFRTYQILPHTNSYFHRLYS